MEFGTLIEVLNDCVEAEILKAGNERVGNLRKKTERLGKVVDGDFGIGGSGVGWGSRRLFRHTL
jgi:hypothetical protein